MLQFAKFLLTTLLTVTISQSVEASDVSEDESETSTEAAAEAAPKQNLNCDDRNSLANLRGECSDIVQPAKNIVEVDVRGLSSDQVTVKIHEAIKKITQEKSIVERSNEMLDANKSLKIVYEADGEESHATLLVGAGLTRLVERADLKKHIAAGAISAELGAVGFRKVLELAGYRIRSNFAERLAGLATACFVGVAKEAYDSRFPGRHTVDKKDALATCAGGAGILLKTEFKF